MNPELERANILETELEKAKVARDLEAMEKLLPEYEKLVLRLAGKFEQIENFNLIEQLERFRNFYSEHEIETPADFESLITEIWNLNTEEIRNAVIEKGFDEILFIPPYDTRDINDKTTGDYVDSNGNKTQTRELVPIKDIYETRSGARIVLTHKAENLNTPELLATMSKSIYDLCNVTTATEKANIDKLIIACESLPFEGLTLGEYLIADRIHFKETGQHLDAETATWLPSSYSGGRVVYSCWNQFNSHVRVDYDCAVDKAPKLGARSARVFQ